MPGARAMGGSKRSDILLIENALIANFDSLALVVRRRMTRGLALNAYYTWSRTQDMADHSNATLGPRTSHESRRR